MKKPPRSWILVEALLDENDVPFLVADIRAPSRRVGVERVHPPPPKPDHFAEHFKPRAHVVDVTNILHLAHYRDEAAAKALRIVGPCQAPDEDEALRKLTELEAKAKAAAAASAQRAAPLEQPNATPASSPAAAASAHTTTTDPAAAAPRTE